jgi:hypothetical protein
MDIEKILDDLIKIEAFQFSVLHCDKNNNYGYVQGAKPGKIEVSKCPNNQIVFFVEKPVYMTSVSKDLLVSLYKYLINNYKDKSIIIFKS